MSNAKTVLVTGATGPIGRAICRALADSGCRIVIHYRSARGHAEAIRRSIAKRGGKAWTICADFGNAGEAERLVERSLELSGTLTAVVNNASIFTESTADTVTVGDILDNVRINTWAPFVVGREFRRLCGKGAIVNLLDSRICGGDPAHSGYIISKRLLSALTRQMALKFGPAISVNSVAPGLITLPKGLSARAVTRLVRNLPLQKPGTPEDVAQAVLFLLESSFVTGQVIFVDGGRQARECARQGASKL